MKYMTRSAVVLLAGLAAACYTHKPVTAAEAQAETVRFTFARAAEVRVTGDADATSVVAVRELSGLVLNAEGDSIRVVVSEGEDVNGKAIAGGAIAMIPQSAQPQMERRRMSVSRSFGAVFAGTAAVAALFILMVQLDK
jgi:hypothetical protein